MNEEQKPSEEDQQHPKGALAWILIYLAILTAFWISAYSQLWSIGGVHP